MMIKPGISELMENLDSRYTLAMMVAKRARELALDTTTPLVKVKSDKPVTIAVNEVAAGKIDIVSQNVTQENVTDVSADFEESVEMPAEE